VPGVDAGHSLQGADHPKFSEATRFSRRPVAGRAVAGPARIL